MKLSNQTLTILKNFSTINPSLQFRQGDILTTISITTSIVAEARIQESLPRDFAIYDLPMFVNVLSQMKEPELEFYDNHVSISKGNSRAIIVYANPSTIRSFNKKIQMPETSISLNPSESDLREIFKIASAIEVPELVICSNGETISMIAVDTVDKSSNRFVIDTGEPCDKKFNLTLKIENMKIIEGTYKVLISDEIVNFRHENNLLNYWVAVESNSGI